MGAQVAERLPLDRVYTRLRVAGVGPEGRQHEPIEEDLRRERHLELPEALSRSPHAVLIGDPGSGKTTFLRFAAQVLARSLLTRDPRLATRELGLDATTAEEIPFPVLVYLSSFARFLADQPNDSCPEDAPDHLLRYLDFDLQGRNLGLSEGYLRRRVTSGGCFLLLDGLDEVPGALRTRVAAIVDELVATGSTDRPNRHLITCRTRAYQRLAHLGGLPAYPLAPFDDDQVATFIRGWSRALFQVRDPGSEGAGAGPDASREAAEYEAELLEAIRSHEDVGPMTESPLMLTMLAVVHWNQKKLPECRNELYEVAISYLLDSHKDHFAFTTSQRQEALQALALDMFTDPEGVQRSLGLPEASRAVAPVLETGEAEGRAFLEAEALESGIVVSHTEGEVEFWHLSFQEYLAARELKTDGQYWDVLSKDGRLYDDRWSEVVLLLAGCLCHLDGRRATRRLLEKILATGTDRVSEARAVGLVGRILVDLKPYGGDPAAGTAYSTALENAITIFKPPAEGEEVVEEAVRVDVGEALGQAGDPRLAKPEENRVAIPGGTFWRGAQTADSEAPGPGYDPDAFGDESPVRRVTVSPFVLGRYPVTVQEYRRFVEAGDEGYLDPRSWDPEGWTWREREGYTSPDSWNDQLRHPNRPVTYVSWYEADAFCRWAGGRLPTEAEWELAARGLEGRRYPWGEEEPDSLHANFAWNVGRPTPVGIYPLGATPEGLHDLAGNVWEWCADWFGNYPPEDEEDPTGPPSGASRVLRGGSFICLPRYLRAAYRDGVHPEGRFDNFGFRVCCSSSGGL